MEESKRLLKIHSRYEIGPQLGGEKASLAAAEDPQLARSLHQCGIHQIRGLVKIPQAGIQWNKTGPPRQRADPDPRTVDRIQPSPSPGAHLREERISGGGHRRPERPIRHLRYYQY